MSSRSPPSAEAVFDIDRPAAAVFVVDPAAGLGSQIGRFAARFGLTIAETRVLREIIGGNGLLAAAARLNITEATARAHAKHVLSKTGTNRRTELIRRFFETALPGLAGRRLTCPKYIRFFCLASSVPIRADTRVVSRVFV